MDKEVFELIELEKLRQKSGLELIASENYVSDHVLQAVGSILTNKYAEGLPSKRYYGGCEVVDRIESLAIERLKQLFGATWANVQPHSGANANSAVMLALLNPGDSILGLDLAQGGHLTHGSPVNYSGKLYRPSFYHVNKETGRIDMNEVRDQALIHRPKLIICGASAYSRDWDYAAFRAIADEVGAILMADISHPAGLIAKGLLNHPFPHCHVVTSTTHKTLRGPRGGIIMTQGEYPNPLGLKTPKGEIRTISSVLDSGVFPGMQGGPLEHVIAGKAVAFQEALSDSFTGYGQQVMTNANSLANHLMNLGYKLVSDGTDNHCFLVDLRNKNVSGKDAENALVQAEITVNKNMVPYDDKSPFVTSGIRIGTPAITTRGLLEADMEFVAKSIDKVIQNVANMEVIEKVRAEVEAFMQDRPLFTNL